MNHGMSFFPVFCFVGGGQGYVSPAQDFWPFRPRIAQCSGGFCAVVRSLSAGLVQSLSV